MYLRGKLPLVACIVTWQKKLAYLTQEGNGKTSIQNKNPTGYPFPQTTPSEVYLRYQVGAVCVPVCYMQEAISWPKTMGESIMILFFCQFSQQGFGEVNPHAAEERVSS